MLDIALDELAGGGAQQVVPRCIRFGEGQGHAVLKLVAEAEGAAGLIEGRARPEAAGKRLIKQPAVQHDVHRPVGRLDLNRPKHGRPVICHLVKNGVEVGLTITGDQRPGLVGRFALSDERDDFDRLADANFHDALQSRAGIEAGTGRPGQRGLADERRRRREFTIAAKKLGAISRPGRLPAAEIGKGDSAGESDAPGISGQYRAAGPVDLGCEERARSTARRAEHPFRIGRDR